MKVLPALTLVAALQLPASTQEAEPGPISITVLSPDFSTAFRIVSPGKVSVSEHGTGSLVGLGGEKSRDAGYVAYDRVAALVKPIRRWAGRTVPCGDAKQIADGGFWAEPEAIVRWEAEGVEIKVRLSCRTGEIRDEIELVRAAIDEMSRWINELPPSEPFDGAPNSAAVVIGNEEQ